jgi:hypothetical protein
MVRAEIALESEGIRLILTSRAVAVRVGAERRPMLQLSWGMLRRGGRNPLSDVHVLVCRYALESPVRRVARVLLTPAPLP